MSDSAQILGQQLATGVVLASGTMADSLFLYRVPQLTETISTATPKSASFPFRTIVSSMIVCNTDSVSRTYNVALIANEDIGSANSVTQDDKQFLIDARELNSKATEVIGLGMTISAGDAIYVWASQPSVVSFNLFGFEIS